MTLPARVLVIDCQVFQSSTWLHGIGQYSFALLTALARRQEVMPYGAVRLLFNRELEIAEDRVAPLKALFPTAAVDMVALRHNRESALAAAAVNQATIDRCLQAFAASPVDYLIPAMFLPDGAAVFPSRARKLLIFYDLIPLLFHERYTYLNRAHFDDYLSRFGPLYQADLIFTISQTTADDLQVYLGISPERLVNIDGAAIDLKSVPAVRPGAGIEGPYVLAPTGGEQRKNITRGVTAFEEVAHAHGGQLRLVLTSLFEDEFRDHLQSLSAGLVFAGHVSTSELRWLYENAEAVLFPSEYEGLGLPVLEAVAAGKPVACSDIPVVREMSTSAFYLFDPLSVGSIARALDASLRAVEWPSRKAEYPTLLDRYSWQRTSERMVCHLSEPPRAPRRHRPRKRIAVLTPDVSRCSPVSALTLALHAGLSQGCDLEYFLDRDPTARAARPNPLRGVVPCHDARDFTGARYREFDAVIYHLGGAEPQVRTLLSALHLPGYAVLHGPDLSKSFERAAELGLMSAGRVKLEQSIDPRSGDRPESYLGSLLSAQLGAIAHSEITEALARRWLRDGAPWLRLDLPTAVPARASWDGRGTGLRVGVWIGDAGTSVLAEVRAATSRIAEGGCELTAFLGCSSRAPAELDGAIDRVPQGHDLAFQTAISRQDVLVKLGPVVSDAEAGVIVDAVRYGVVVVLEDTSWASDPTQAGLVRIADRRQLGQALEQLAAHPQTLRSAAEAGRQRMRELSYGKYADAVVDFITASESGPRNRVNHRQAQGVRAGWNWRRIWETVPADRGPAQGSRD